MSAFGSGPLGMIHSRTCWPFRSVRSADDDLRAADDDASSSSPPQAATTSASARTVDSIATIHEILLARLSSSLQKRFK